MNKTIHSITVNVFEKNKNNIENILSLYQKLLPLDFEEENLSIQQEKLEGFHDKEIYSITLQTTKNKHNKLLFKTLMNPLSKTDIQTLIQQIESRLNDEGYFFLRLNKKALLNNAFNLTDSGDCFHIKIKMAAYPAKRPIFIETIDQLLKSYNEKKE